MKFRDFKEAFKVTASILLIAGLFQPLLAQNNQAIPKGVEYDLGNGVRLWIPATIGTKGKVRAVFVHDSYDKNPGEALYLDTLGAGCHILWQQLASETHCAQLLRDDGIVRDSIGGRRIADKLTGYLNKAAEISTHLELSNSPLILTGLSAIGESAYHVAECIPNRVLAVIGYHGISIRGIEKSAMDITTTMRKIEIPVLYLMAGNDRERVPAIQSSIEKIRASGALWSVALQPNLVHHLIGDQDFIVLWVKDILRQRLSKNKNGSPYLKNLNYKKAWLGTYTLLDKGPGVFGGNYHLGYPSIIPVRKLKSDLNFTIFLPDKRIAKKWLKYTNTGVL